MTDSSLAILEDSSPPDLGIYRPRDGKTYELDEDLNVTVEWGGSDDRSGIDHYKIRIDDGIWIEVGDSTNYTLEELDEGEYTVTVRAVDRAGNEAEETISFEVERTLLDMVEDFVYSYHWYLISIFAFTVLAVLLLINRERNRRDPVEYENTYNLRDKGSCGMWKMWIRHPGISFAVSQVWDGIFRSGQM